MHKSLMISARAASIVVSMALLSACASVGAPNQFANANAVNGFDESRTPFGARIALAEGGFTTRVDSLYSDITR